MDMNNYASPLLSSDGVREMDEYMLNTYGVTQIVLMNNAAASVYAYICETVFPAGVSGLKVSVLCHSGGNGGDGYALARMLRDGGVAVTVISLKAPEGGAALYYRDKWLAEGGTALEAREAAQTLAQADLIVDAIFGTGFHGRLPDDIARLLHAANASGAVRLAVDIPTGVECDTARAGPGAFRAGHTVSFTYSKPGLESYPGRAWAGRVHVAGIGISQAAKDRFIPQAELLDAPYCRSLLPYRSEYSNKGTYGRLICVCGSEDMTGAAILAARGALRSGVGLLDLAVPEQVVRVMQNWLTEPVFTPLPAERGAREALLSQKLAQASAVLAGCGLSQSERAKETLLHILHNCDRQLIIDADGINILAAHIDELDILSAKSKAGAIPPPIFTPHPAEFARLLGTDTAAAEADRIGLARMFATGHGCVVLLKGNRTVIASPDGRIAINPTGNDGMAKGGSGDLLAGMVASLCAQGMAPAEAARLGAYLHGLAGDLCAEALGRRSMQPGDMADCIPEAFKHLESV